MTNKQPEALRLAKEWKTKAQKEASRQNSAYDVYGMGNTPESVDPLGASMAAELRRQHARIAELEAQLATAQPAAQGLDAQIIQALSAGMSIEQWQSSVDVRIGSSGLLGRAIASGEETRIELVRRAVSEALAAQAKQG